MQLFYYLFYRGREKKISSFFQAITLLSCSSNSKAFHSVTNWRQQKCNTIHTRSTSYIIYESQIEISLRYTKVIREIQQQNKMEKYF